MAKAGVQLSRAAECSRGWHGAPHLVPTPQLLMPIFGLLKPESQGSMEQARAVGDHQLLEYHVSCQAPSAVPNHLHSPGSPVEVEHLPVDTSGTASSQLK